MELKGKMGWPAPTNAGGETYGTNKVISVHVRKGDSCVAEGRVKKYGSCANFGRYAKEIRILKRLRETFLISCSWLPTTTVR